MDLKNLGVRTLVAIFGIPFILFVIYIGNPYFLFLITFVQILSLQEFFLLAQKKTMYPSLILGGSAIFLINLCIVLNDSNLFSGLVTLIIIMVLIVELFKGKPNAIANAGATLLGVGYISLFSFLILIRDLPDRISAPGSTGAFIVMLIFATIWICDTAAYLIGASFGKHRLFERISPKKTWEGAIAGFASSILFSMLFTFIMIKQLNLFDAVIIGIIAGVIGQISDLVESLFKRDATQKDSSNLLPGHGGILDRFDSPILIAPAVFAYLYFFTMIG